MKLKEAREKAGVGYSECIRLAKLDHPALYKYEAGKAKPSLARALRIARVLGVELTDVEEFRPALKEAMETGLVIGGDKVT